MEFDLSGIKLSNYDVKRGLVLPRKDSKELAEFVGILAGDGYVSFNTNRNVISISGDSMNDLHYLTEHVKPMLKRLFNLDVKVSKRKTRRLAEIVFESKTLVEFLRLIGYYKHHSRGIKIPNWITKNDNYFLYTLKGLSDTDFSLMLYKNRKLYPHYPVIAITSADKLLILSLSGFLNKGGFNVDLILDGERFDKRSGKIRIEHRLRLSGRQNLELWMRLVGFRNKRHLNKYKEYLESGRIMRKIGRPQKNISGLENEENGTAGI